MKISAKSAILVIEKKTLHQALVEQWITKTKKQKRTILLSIQVNKSRETPNPVEKSQKRIQKFSRKEQEERLGKKVSSVNSNTHINQAWNTVVQLKGKNPKKKNIFQVNGAQYKTIKSIANKIDNTLAELSLLQNYDSTFLELTQKEEQKTIHVNHTNKENYKKPFSKEELSRAIQNTKNSAPDPDKIHNEMLKHLPLEGLDSLLAL